MNDKDLTIVKCEGRKVKHLFYGDNGDCLQEAQTKEGFCREIVVSTEFFGEYSIVWFIIFENGNEVRRINGKYVFDIIWES